MKSVALKEVWEEMEESGWENAGDLQFKSFKNPKTGETYTLNLSFRYLDLINISIGDVCQEIREDDDVDLSKFNYGYVEFYDRTSKEVVEEVYETIGQQSQDDIDVLERVIQFIILNGTSSLATCLESMSF